MNNTEYANRIEELKNLTPKFSEKNGKPYIEWEQYKDAMNGAFGTSYEPLMVGEPIFTILPKENGGTTSMATVTVEVTIYDDTRNVIAKRRAPGSVVYEKVKDTGEYAWPQNVTFNAWTAAFRNCCKLFGVFENAERPKGQATNYSANSGSRNEEPKNDATLFHVATKGNISITGGDNGRKKVYKVRCVDKADNVEKDLVIYEGKVETSKLSELVEKVNIGPGVSCVLSFYAYVGKKGNFDRPQLIFQKFM